MAARLSNLSNVIYRTEYTHFVSSQDCQDSSEARTSLSAAPVVSQRAFLWAVFEVEAEAEALLYAPCIQSTLSDFGISSVSRLRIFQVAS